MKKMSKKSQLIYLILPWPTIVTLTINLFSNSIRVGVQFLPTYLTIQVMLNTMIWPTTLTYWACV